MCKGCEIRTRQMVKASAEFDQVRAFLRDALANGHDDGAAGAIDEALGKLDVLAVMLAGPSPRPSPALSGNDDGSKDASKNTPKPAPAREPAQPGFTHAARAAEAMERSAA